MSEREREAVLRWRCPSCHAEWYDRGAGFPGTRFSRCLGCGTDACEGADARPAFTAAPERRREPTLR